MENWGGGRMLIQLEKRLFVGILESTIVESLTRVSEMSHSLGLIGGEPFHLKQMSIWSANFGNLSWHVTIVLPIFENIYYMRNRNDNNINLANI